jgi:transposase-like protein
MVESMQNLYLMMVEIKETVLEDGTVRREIPTEYRCYYCNGVINKVEYYRYKIKMFHRWTCSSCNRDFGYDTEEPLRYKRL